MKSYLPTATLISLALLVAACQPAAEQPDPAAEAAQQAEDVAAIKNLDSKWNTAVNAGDAAALANLHTDDAIRMPPNQPAVVGKEAIQSSFQTIFEQFTGKLTLSPEEVEVVGDWAFARGTYAGTRTPKAGGEPTEDNGKYLAIFLRQPDGSWKHYRGIWNSDKPLPGTGE